MSFGTGHHQTTFMMLEFALGEVFREKSVLDMGCGTGILAIMASKMGAKRVDAIDNDPWCIENSKENISEVSKSGADTFVAGSAIFNTKNYKDTISNLKSLID